MARIVKRLRNGPYTVMVDGRTRRSAAAACPTRRPSAMKRTRYDSSRKRHPVADEHPEMCTEQKLESW